MPAFLWIKAANELCLLSPAPVIGTWFKFYFFYQKRVKLLEYQADTVCLSLPPSLGPTYRVFPKIIWLRKGLLRKSCL